MSSTKSDNFYKNLKAMHTFAETYARQTNTFFSIDPAVTSVIITGLATYKENQGVPLCPCRNYSNEEAEIELNYWICPCVSMRERKECHCRLFIQPNESDASSSQKIDFQTICNNL